jgi:hypothetical protein
MLPHLIQTTQTTLSLLLNELLRPLLGQQELLVNRLLAKEPLAVTTLDASLANREAIKKPVEYVPQTDEAEAERIAEVLGKADALTQEDLANAGLGWTSLDLA